MLKYDVSFVNGEVERDSIDPWETDKARQFTLIVFEKADRVRDLNFKVGKLGIARSCVKS